MKLYIKNIGSNYLAKVVSLPTPVKHPNADKLALVTIDNQTIIVGNNARAGEVYIYFPLETAINKDFLKFTNSFSDPLLNADGKTKGFFNDKGRVRAVKLRGTPSEGYLVPANHVSEWLAHLSFSNAPKFDEIGKEFDSIEMFMDDGDLGSEFINILLCEKYVPSVERSKGLSNQTKKDKTKRFDRMIPGQFHFHVDTQNLKKNIDKIQPDDIITITEKLHGTSAVFSKILVKRKLNWLEKIAKYFGVRVQETEYDVVYSSRSVLKNSYLYDEKTQAHWYKEDIWGLAKEKVKHALTPGLTIYAEIVGQLPTGSWIQKNYDYGTNPNEFEVYVYRITSTDADGNVREFTTNQIASHCLKHGLKMVPIHYYGIAAHYVFSTIEPFHEALLNNLQFNYLEKTCSMCKNNVPAEGVVVTVERDEFTAYKLKSFAFLEGETKALDSGEVDIETEQSITQ